MTSPADQGKSFVSALFDLNFTTFVTLKFIRVIYILVLVLSALGGIAVFASLASRGVGGVIAGLIVGPLVALIYLVVGRIYLELVAVLFRIGEDVSTLARRPDGLG